MKKLLSLALILALVATLTTSVFATRVVGDPDGVPSFPDTEGDATTVSVQATVGTIQHRYAVDIEFPGLSVAVSGSTMTWDVNDLKYVTSEGAATPDNTTAKVTFTNRSDLPVYVSYDETDADANDFLSVEIKANGVAASEGVKYEIAKATVGTATPYIFDLTVVASDDNWNNVAEYYAEWFSANSDKTQRDITSIVFTVSQVAPTPTP